MMKNKEYSFLEDAISILGSEHSQEYLSKFWLEEKEFYSKWSRIFDTIFKNDKDRIPQNIFREDYVLIPIMMTGGVFYEETFDALRKCMIELGEKEFIVVEQNKEYQLRFRYPVEIDWRTFSLEDNNTEYIIMELLATFKNYYVLGDSGIWGKYYEGEHKYSFDIIGVKEEYAGIFYNHFKNIISLEERNEINNLLPQYKEKIVWNLRY